MPRRRATTIATEGRLALVPGPANSRMFVYLAGNWLHRIERERRELYFGDLDLALVAELIGTGGVEPGMRDAGFRAKHKDFSTAIPVAEQRAMNASSIATAAGIPRETVRRKIAKLLKLGFIVEKEPARYVLKPGVLLEPERQAAFARGIEQTVRFVNELLENGVVRWEPAKKGKAVARK
ncbi:MAG: helix-turn-helix domain-containing protein [Reyranella sp.]|nr:helix-turn-helix domain-containing protein [Reyranella sp.]